MTCTALDDLDALFIEVEPEDSGGNDEIIIGLDGLYEDVEVW